MAVIFTINSAFFYGLSNLTRIGLRNSNPVSAALINLPSGLATCLFIFLFAIPIGQFGYRTVLCFILYNGRGGAVKYLLPEPNMQ